MKLTPFGRWFLIIAALVAIFFIVRAFLPKQEAEGIAAQPAKDKVRLAIYKWPGFSVGTYANLGLQAGSKSRFLNRGVDLEIDIYHSEADAINAWVRGEADLLGCSWSQANIQYKDLAKRQAKVVCQVDWDRGNHRLFAARGINTVNQLAGQSVGILKGSEGSFFLFNALFAAGMGMDDVQLTPFSDRSTLVEAINEGSLKAAVLDVSYMADAELPDEARSIISTQELSHAIAHVIIGSETDLKNNVSSYNAFYDGWISASGDLKAYPDALDSAAMFWADIFEIDEKLVNKSLKRMRFATHGDNMNFFGRLAKYRGPKADLGQEICIKYLRQMDMPVPAIPMWKNWLFLEPLLASKQFFKRQEQEGYRNYRTLTESEQGIPAVAILHLYLDWPNNGDEWSAADRENLKTLETIQRLTWITRNRIRAHAFTDENTSADLRTSKFRADLLRDYLTSNLDLDPNRYITEGVGDREPAEGCAGSSAPSCMRKNNRVEVQLLTFK
jgi:NitT/TauT family transport system substrate-binding protein